MQGVCLISTQRSGTAWVIQLLNAHPQVRAYKEVFTHRPIAGNTAPDRSIWPPFNYCDYRSVTRLPRPFRTAEYLNILEAAAYGHDAFAFKLMYNQLEKHLELLYLMRRRSFRILHLVRRNLLDGALSLFAKRQSGIAHAFSANASFAKLTIDTAELLQVMRKRDRRTRRHTRLLRLFGNRLLEVEYETLRQNTAAELSRIWSHLGVDLDPDIADSRTYKKITPDRLEEKISNVDEVFDALLHSEFADQLPHRDAPSPQARGCA